MAAKAKKEKRKNENKGKAGKMFMMHASNW